jgi:hypothetical protein
MVSKLIARGRKQTEDLMKELEKLLDKPLAQADRLRRKAGVGPGFPIIAYDDLSVAQVRSRLDDLGRPELRKVRTYETNNKARKGILDDIESKLG